MNAETANETTMDDEHVVPPDARSKAQAIVVGVLWKTFRRSTGVDLDAVAGSIVDGLIDPELQRAWDRREAALATALTAAMAYYQGEITDLERRLELVQRQRDKAREELRWRKLPAETSS